MAPMQDVIATLKRKADQQERGRHQLLGVAKLLETATNIVAWQVAVVTPGFLGLLWNGRALSEATRLPDGWYLAVFIAAELAFLLAILSAVSLHSWLGGASAAMTMRANHMALARGIAVDAQSAGEITQELVDRITDLDQDLKSIELEDMPWWFGPAMSAHRYLAIAGYVLTGAIIAAMKFN
jgi:hypothetical protein